MSSASVESLRTCSACKTCTSKPATAFVNCPYGRGVTGRWVEKAWHAAGRGATVVLLLPARTDTAWFQGYCFRGEVRFLRGRIRFLQNGVPGNPAPFPSAVVIFRPRT